jgi:hypothetical protein
MEGVTDVSSNENVEKVEVTISKKDYVDAIEVLEKKFKRRIKMELTQLEHFHQLLQPPEFVEKMKQVVLFWNQEYEKILKIPVKDNEVISILCILEQKIGPIIQQELNFAPEHVQQEINGWAKDEFMRIKQKKMPISKEQLKKNNDSFLPDYLKK